MEALLPIIIQLVGGAIGGNVVGAALKQAALSPVGRSIIGAVGGVGGGLLLSVLGGDMGALSGMAGDAVGGVAGGGVLAGIVGMVMSSMKK